MPFLHFLEVETDPQANPLQRDVDRIGNRRYIREPLDLIEEHEGGAGQFVWIVRPFRFPAYQFLDTAPNHLPTTNLIDLIMKRCQREPSELLTIRAVTVAA